MRLWKLKIRDKRALESCKAINIVTEKRWVEQSWWWDGILLQSQITGMGIIWGLATPSHCHLRDGIFLYNKSISEYDNKKSQFFNFILLGD